MSLAVGLPNLQLRSRNIVLGQFANFLKQRGAALIVKELARKCAWLARQARDHFVAKIRFGWLEIKDARSSGVVVHA